MRLFLAAVMVLATGAGASAGPGSQVSERVVIVDLRPDAAVDRAGRRHTRAAFAHKLGAIAGMEVVPAGVDDDMARALAGEVVPVATHREAASAALAGAGEAHAAGDCARAERLANRAVDELSLLQAAGDPVTDELGHAHAYLLLCAHARGDVAVALRVMGRFERLGIHSPPAGVSALVWSLYPAVDATANVPMVELHVLAAQAGAVVWLDHQRVGPAPVTVIVPAGPHILAASHPDGQSGVVRVDVTDASQSVTVPLIEVREDPAGVAARVSRWREDPARVTPGDVVALLRSLEVRFVLVLDETERVRIWALGPGEVRAQIAGEGRMSRPAALATKILARARRWDRAEAGPGNELLREDPAARARTARASSGSPPWWVYATAIGAVTLAASVILAQDLAVDRQRIEIVWP